MVARKSGTAAKIEGLLDESTFQRKILDGGGYLSRLNNKIHELQFRQGRTQKVKSGWSVIDSFLG